MSSDTSRILVIGPEMETRPLPPWTLRPIDDSHLTQTERKVREIGKSIYAKNSIIIEGAPFVNPKGSSKISATPIDYVENPAKLNRTLHVAFLGSSREVPLDGILVAVCAIHEKALCNAKNLVIPRLKKICSNRIVWWVFCPNFGTGLSHNNFATALEPLFK